MERFVSALRRAVLAGGAVLGCTALLVSVFAVVRPDVAEAATITGPSRSAFFIHHDSSPLDVAKEAPRRRVFTFNAWEAAMARQVKATNPDAIVLVYKDLSSTRSYQGAFDGVADAAEIPTGVGYAEASSEHPEWFLTGADGQRLEWEPYPEHWFMDVGNPAYQEAWVTNVLAELRADGWDGVFMDNALTHADAYGSAPAAYPDDEAMQAATRSMLANVGPRLTGSGFVAIANISDARLFPGLWADWIQFTSGALEEHFVNWNQTIGGPYVWDWGPDAWSAMVDEVATAERMGKIALVRTGGNPADTEAARYGYASFLLAAGTNSSFSFQEKGWLTDMQWDLGAPLGPMVSHGRNVYSRAFARGLVIVNAGGSAPATVGFNRSYVMANGKTVRSVKLNATRAMILRSSSVTTSAPRLSVY